VAGSGQKISKIKQMALFKLITMRFCVLSEHPLSKKIITCSLELQGY